MFIRRKSKIQNSHRLKTICYTPQQLERQLANNVQEQPSSSSSTSHSIDSRVHIKPDLQINRYPFFQYFISLSLLLFSIYLFASLAGISWGFLDFNLRQWWHFIVSSLVFAFSIAIMFNSDCEAIYIIKKNNQIIHQSSKFFCLFRNNEIHKIKDIRIVRIVECGAAKKVSLHTRWYGNQFCFSDCSKMIALRCISQQNAQRYRQMIIKTVGEIQVQQIHNNIV